jgi:hypothetical protein
MTKHFFNISPHVGMGQGSRFSLLFLPAAASLLAPKARRSHQSLGQRPRVMKIKKTLALKARFTSGTPVGSAPIELTPPKAFGVICMAI